MSGPCDLNSIIDPFDHQVVAACSQFSIFFFWFTYIKFKKRAGEGMEKEEGGRGGREGGKREGEREG